MTMRYLTKNNAVFLLLPIIISACTSTQSSNEDVVKRNYLEQVNQVDYMVLSSKVFEQEFISNGILKAHERVTMKFKVGGQINELNVKNGNYVKKGAILARLSKDPFQRAIEDAMIAKKKARLDMLDFLIGQGYDVQDSSKVPSDLREIAMIRSGYSNAQNQLKQAQYELDNSIIKAPFGGKVANLQVAKYDQVASGEDICTIINDGQMEVIFHLVESEIHHIQTQNKVSVIPFSTNDTIQGIVTEINPIVDKNGLVEVHASIKNIANLLDGMKVRVSVRKSIPDQLIVPKQAVVLRQNQEVLFKYTQGTAYWTYVQTILENSQKYSVQANPDKGASLNIGDTVIISDNLNLAHESKVKLRRRTK